MAIEWGNDEGHLRVGIDREILSISSTSVTVRFHFWVGPVPSGWDWNDDMTLKVTGSGGGATINFHKGNGDQKVYSRTLSASRSFSGGPTWSVTGTISGAYNGATPSKSSSYTVPAKSVAPPDPPWGPGIEVDAGSQSAGISWGLSTDNNGDAVDNWRVQVGGSTAYLTPFLDKFTDVRNAFVSGLNRATGYYVRVKAHNSAGWGDWSSDKAFNTKPTAPGLVAGRSVGSIFPTSATLSWSPPADDGGRDVDGYQVRWRPSSGGTWTEVLQASTSRVVSDLQPGVQYEFMVRARNAVGLGSYQDTGQLWTTTTATPSGPSMPGIAPGPTSANVIWVTPAANGSTITGYQVQYATTSAFTSPTTETVGVVNNHTLLGLTMDTVYYVRVRATSSNGNGAWSPSRSFSTSVIATPYPVIRFWNGESWVRLNPSSIWDGTDFTEVSDVRYWGAPTNNIAINPTFETNGAWLSSGSISSIAQETAQVLEGNYSAKVTANASPSSTVSGVGLTTSAIAPGQWVAIRIPVRPSGGTPTPAARIRIEWRDGADVANGSSTLARTALTPFTYTSLTLSAQAPAGTASARVYLYLSNSSSDIPLASSIGNTDAWVVSLAATQSAAEAGAAEQYGWFSILDEPY